MNLSSRSLVKAVLSLAVLFAGCANHAPRFLNIQNRNVETGTTLEFYVEAVDDDGDKLEFGCSGKPAAASFDQVDNNRARFSWTPIASDAGPDGSGR